MDTWQNRQTHVLLHSQLTSSQWVELISSQAVELTRTHQFSVSRTHWNSTSSQWVELISSQSVEFTSSPWVELISSQSVELTSSQWVELTSCEWTVVSLSVVWHQPSSISNNEAGTSRSVTTAVTTVRPHSRLLLPQLQRLTQHFLALDRQQKHHKTSVYSQYTGNSARVMTQ